MAIYQLNVELIPNGVKANCDELETWAGYSIPAEALAQQVDLITPRSPPWPGCDGLARWGDDETDDLQLWHEDGRICSLTARFDCGSLSTDFIDRVVKIATKLNLSAFIRDSGQIIDAPTVDKLLDACRRSAAVLVATPAQGSA